MQTAGGVDKHHVIVVGLGVFNSLAGNFHGAYLITQRENCNIQLLAQHLQLLDGGRTVNIGGNQQRTFMFILIDVSNFSNRGGLTGALQTGHHDNRGRLAGHIDGGLLRTHQDGQFLLHNFYNLLSGSKTLQNISAKCALFNGGHKILNNFVADVGFQQSHTHGSHCLVNICLGQLALAGQLLKSVLQFICQAAENCHHLTSFKNSVMFYAFWGSLLPFISWPNSSQAALTSAQLCSASACCKFCNIRRSRRFLAISPNFSS